MDALRLISASIRFVIVWIVILIFALTLVAVPKRNAFGPAYLKFFMNIMMYITGIRAKVHGKLTNERPLLIVSNHMSILDIGIIAMLFGNGFFAKRELRKLPLIGYMMDKFGTIFVDRRPSYAARSNEKVKKQMKVATWPMVIFPEGTTTNGSYVKPFKSTLFNFLEKDGRVEGATIQPVVLAYRTPGGRKISDADLAEHYAYFDNAKQDEGPHCSKERTIFGLLFHIMAMGGILAEVYILPTTPLDGLKNRKELATKLQKIVADEYRRVK
ncbi:MAG: 1-acyl-sn-glycerol-3-phosphate acyltransferase [Alphaproteobacteria bacterium]|nr:1-acyl-sn-glycerol-3-phosphate acyltransferase [Alphaproteobacteria bacterium]